MKSTLQPDENNEKVIIDTRPEMRPVFKWVDLDGAIFTKKVKDAYKEIVYCRNFFSPPTGNASKNYLEDMSWINENAIKDIVFKPLTIMPNLLLRKP